MHEIILNKYAEFAQAHLKKLRLAIVDGWEDSKYNTSLVFLLWAVKKLRLVSPSLKPVSFKDKGMPTVPSHWKNTCEKGTKFSQPNCNKKLICARSFPQGYEAIVVRVNQTVDYRSPRDFKGHGTHTASTAGGNVVEEASMFWLSKGLGKWNEIFFTNCSLQGLGTFRCNSLKTKLLLWH
ncbi:hypothetical protein ACLB2K_073772 [Fragaria x ananassa]